MKLRWHDRNERNARKRYPLEALGAGLVHERKLNLTLLKQRRHLIAADGHIYLDIGVERLEFLQKLGQRGARNARKAAEAELVALGAALRGGLLAQRIASIDNAFYIRKKMLSLFRKADAVTAAIEQRAACLL